MSLEGQQEIDKIGRSEDDILGSLLREGARRFAAWDCADCNGAGVLVEKIGRNAPCVCGSGKKDKRCCRKSDGARIGRPCGCTATKTQAWRQRYRAAIAELQWAYQEAVGEGVSHV